MSDKRFEKSPCSKCSEQCYSLCYIGSKLVCVDCFAKACEKAERTNKEDKG